MPLYLMDTNIISDLVRNPRGAAAERVIACQPAELCTSIIVAAELRFGVLRRGSERLTEAVEAVLARLNIRALEPPADAHYAKIRHALQQTGNLIGQNDMLIAAHALALEAVLVTDNSREFGRVQGLQVQNWVR
ncbi:MAG: type II toxin-antitoxin system VapC family toxin [Bosea sp. (in: a-proteobacteria)]